MDCRFPMQGLLVSGVGAGALATKNHSCKVIKNYTFNVFPNMMLVLCLFDLILYIQVNNFSVMSGWIFLG